MKLFTLFFFLLILSCTTSKKVYLCGDHACANKKEFNEYFSKNLTIEISLKKKKINKNNNDLINLNTENFSKKKERNKSSKIDGKLKKKNEEAKSKAEKIRLLDEQKLKEIAKNNQEKEQLRIAKLSEANKEKQKSKNNSVHINRKKVKTIVSKADIEKKNVQIKNPTKNMSNNPIIAENVESICYGVKDCDIDKIKELLIKKGKDKPFPNIASK